MPKGLSNNKLAQVQVMAWHPLVHINNHSPDVYQGQLRVVLIQR